MKIGRTSFTRCAVAYEVLLLHAIVCSVISLDEVLLLYQVLIGLLVVLTCRQFIVLLLLDEA